jgi:poly-gamma-glutamate capsule biosynthesis protein CapA/YwtB (metallophosphatase superfamily)
LNSYNRYRRRRGFFSYARNRRMVFFGALALVLIGVIVLIVCLVTGGNKDDKSSPQITPISSAAATAIPTVVPTTAPISTAEANQAPAADASSEPTASGDENSAGPIDVSDIIAADPDASGSENSGGLRQVHFRVLGDVMFHEEQLKIAKQSDGSYNFDSQFKYIADSIGAADYTIANLETTVGKYKDTSYSGYPQFNTPESVLTTLDKAGIDFFTMANNHMLDRWFDGMIQDVDLVEEYGFDHVGAYRTQEERNTPVIYEINGIKFGFVAYTHTTNTMERYSDEAAQEYGVPYLYKSDIAGDIKKLRDAGAEVVIALPHWGEENTYIPDDTQKSYAKKLAKAGADIILGSHSHMVEPMQLISGKDSTGANKEVFMIYSMGNFISSMTMQRTDNGIILDFTVSEQPDGSFKVKDVGYVPIYVWKQNKQLYVLPIPKYVDNRPEGMNDAQYNRMLESYRELVDVLGTENFTVLSE